MSDADKPIELTAVLFADLGGSTRLYEKYGDVRAHDIAGQCLARLETVTAEFGGRVVKHIGDEIMCVFAEANDAVAAALEMQARIKEPVEGEELTIHIGLHWGQALHDGGDVFGDAVNLAARIASLAHARQILTTDATVAKLGPTLRAATRLVDRRHVKGKQGDVDVYEVMWESSAESTQFHGVEARSSLSPVLRITMGGTQLDARDDRPAVTIGRSLDNDFVLNDQAASRHHAKLERRGDKWVLKDFSANGTMVAADNGPPVLVHNEQVLLPLVGGLGIGNPTPGRSALVIRFEHLFE